MTFEGHEAIVELLAGHVLHALDEGEAARAEDLLASHVPSCPECSATLESFGAVAGDLGLVAGSRRPPRLLGLRIRRETSSRKLSVWLGRSAGVAAVLLVGAVLLWNVHLSGRVNRAEERQARTTEVLYTVSHPESRIVPFSAERSELESGAMTAAFLPGRHFLYLYGSLPDPAPGHVYQLWLSREGQFRTAGTFLPEAGLVLLRLAVNPASYDGVLITEEPASGSQEPSDRRVVTAAF
ncbi:MAG TPA: anti-sigma factor [Actinomycetota bacterium]